MISLLVTLYYIHFHAIFNFRIMLSLLSFIYSCDIRCLFILYLAQASALINHTGLYFPHHIHIALISIFLSRNNWKNFSHFSLSLWLAEAPHTKKNSNVKGNFLMHIDFIYPWINFLFVQREYISILASGCMNFFLQNCIFMSVASFFCSCVLWVFYWLNGWLNVVENFCKNLTKNLNSNFKFRGQLHSIFWILKK